MSDSILHLTHPQIADALDIQEADLRALRRVMRPNIRTIPAGKSHRGRLPAAYNLKDVVAWLATVGNLLTDSAELRMREAARLA